MSVINVWIIEDNANFLSTTTRAIKAKRNDHHVKGFNDCESAIDCLECGERPDVVLIDIGLPGMNGIEGIGQIKQRAPHTSILVLTVFDDDEKIFKALRAGASGYLLKSDSIEKLVDAIDLVQTGASPLNPAIASRVLRLFQELPVTQRDYGLTDREQSFLEHMAQGLGRKQIAAETRLNMHTVDYVMRCIFRKLHVNGATAAVALAIREKIIDVEGNNN